MPGIELEKELLTDEQEMERAIEQTREALVHIFKVGHGEISIGISDKRMVNFNYKAQWQLRKEK